MQRSVFAAWISAALLLGAPASFAGVLTPNDDVTVRPGRGNLDESEPLGLLVKADGSASFVEFTLGGVAVSEATLRLRNFWSNAAAPVDYDVRVRAGVFDFSETSLTHATQPDDSGWTLVVISFHVDDVPRSYDLDVTDLYNAHLGETVTFSLRSAGGSGDGPIFADREGTGGQAGGPVIEVTVAAGPPLIEEVVPDPEQVTAGVPYERQLALLSGAPPVGWSLTRGPAGLSVDGNGRLSGWTPGAGSIGETFEIEIEAENAFGLDRESWSVLVVSPPPDPLLGGGWLAHYYKPPGELTAFPDLDLLEPRGAAVVVRIDVEATTGQFVPRGLDFVDDFAVRYEGVLTASEGITAFHVTADDEARLVVDGVPVVVLENPAGGSGEASGEVFLSAGEHCLVVDYLERRGAAGLRVEFTPPGGVRQVLPPSVMEPEPCASGAVRVPRWRTFEIALTASTVPDNPFTDLQLEAEVTAPDGRVLEVGGYHDGDGRGGSGNVWKLRLTPDQVGLWRWRTTSDDPALDDQMGEFACLPSVHPGPVVAAGRFFARSSGEPVYLLGNFLDRAAPEREQFSHTLLSEEITEGNRQSMIRRHRDLHRASKINVYLANRGDYGGISTTPWVGSDSSNDKTRFDLARWRLYDEIVAQLRDEGMVAELWFFADDSGFGDLADADRERLIAYGLARLGAYSHTMFVLALEWQEGWSAAEVRSHGRFIQDHNPWRRLVSVHGTTGNFSFAGEDWVDFMATQSGNSIDPAGNNAHTIANRALAAKPLIVEEFGILEAASDSRLRGNLWAAFCGGAAGSGTGSDLRALRGFIERTGVAFWRMAPANALANHGFVLAEEGKEYVVYVTDDRDLTLQLDADAPGEGTYQVSWFDPRGAGDESAFSLLGEVAAGRRTFSPPSEGDWVLHATARTPLPADFVRGNANADAQIDLSDAVFILGFLFLGGPVPSCVAASNTNGDGQVDISDASYLLSHLFLGGPAPPSPYPACGATALDADARLGCDTSRCP